MYVFVEIKGEILIHLKDLSYISNDRPTQKYL